MNSRDDKRQRQLLIQGLFVLVLIVAVLFLFWQLGAFNPVKKTRIVTYKVDGNGPVIITFVQPDGKVNTTSGVFPPWKSTDYIFPRQVDTIITVGNQAQTGMIRCQILIDGQVYWSETANSPNDKVTCSGKVP